MRLIIFSGLFLLNILSFANLHAQNKEKLLGDGLHFTAPDSSFHFQFRYRMQQLYEAEYHTEQEDWKHRFLIRRSRVKFDGFVLDTSLVYDIELGLTNRDIGVQDMPQNNYASNLILDAVLKWNFNPGWSLWIGQTKLPGNRQRVVSSQNMQLVDRSILNANYTLDRDKGIQLRHEGNIGNAGYRINAAISIGEGRNITEFDNGGYNYTLRAEYLPFGKFQNGGDYFEADLARESSPKLSIAANYNYNDDTYRSRGQEGSFMDETRTLHSLTADLMFKYKGFSTMMEWVKRETPHQSPIIETNPVNTYYTGYALNLQSGYLFKNNWEIAGRYAFTNPEKITGFSREDHYTAGLSKYIHKHYLKVQTDITWKDIRSAENQWLYRFQFEISI